MITFTEIQGRYPPLGPDGLPDSAHVMGWLSYGRHWCLEHRDETGEITGVAVVTTGTPLVVEAIQTLRQQERKAIARKLLRAIRKRWPGIRWRVLTTLILALIKSTFSHFSPTSSDRLIPVWTAKW